MTRKLGNSGGTDMSDNRLPDGKFRSGHAVKGGRTPGPSRAERLAEAIEPHIPDIIAKAIELAKLGDPASQKLILERYAPIAKQDAERVIVEGFASAPTLELKAQAVMSAVASGQVTAEAGERLLRTLDAYARVVVADDHEKRLQAIEAGRNAPKPVTLDHDTGRVLDNLDDLA
ncbi:hypothetical protein CJ010_09735 [Azoarcus sp. DD4]|uniref:hypothetical protein n=1 Tax=Azoarcus sp. DD4 TaxID=2027405 RepID=UPI00112D25D0|nr:hypothetical protein [Azoarcus sp. DD4]QDF96789.1 hypothetical protein CJ010_09735 [Azoarcus sp. DD4]